MRFRSRARLSSHSHSHSSPSVRSVGRSVRRSDRDTPIRPCARSGHPFAHSPVRPIGTPARVVTFDESRLVNHVRSGHPFARSGHPYRDTHSPIRPISGHIRPTFVRHRDTRSGHADVDVTLPRNRRRTRQTCSPPERKRRPPSSSPRRRRRPRAAAPPSFVRTPRVVKKARRPSATTLTVRIGRRRAMDRWMDGWMDGCDSDG